MKLLTATLLLFTLLFNIRHSISSQAKSKEYMLFYPKTDLPGPSMSFDISLSQASLAFQFKTFVEKAVVLYQDDMGIADHVELVLDGGRIYFGFFIKKPGGTGNYVSQEKFNDFKWHSVRIERNATSTRLILDERLVMTAPTDGPQKFFDTNLLIGGFPPRRLSTQNEISKPSAFTTYILPLDKRGFFNACVRNFKYAKVGKDWEEVTDIVSERYHVSEGCGLNYCHKPDPICKNEGICTPIENNEVKCDCRWTGFEGKNCTKTSLELFLNGSYAIEYKLKQVKALENEEYIFRIKTKQRHAVILHAQGASINDKLLIEIVKGKIVVKSSLGGNPTDDKLTSKINIADGKWHLVKYRRRQRNLSLVVDNNEWKATNVTLSQKDYVKMDYGSRIQISKYNKLIKHAIILQDFIWKHDQGNHAPEINFISGLFESFRKPILKEYFMIPESTLPTFNRILQLSSNPTRTSVPAYPTQGPKGCSERDEIRCPRTEESIHNMNSGSTSPTIHTENVMGRKAGDDDDSSSVTWIVVVTVICVLIVFVIVFFFFRKWNKRYSGDFEVCRKEIGPAATVVHYKDSGLKEKQRQVKI